MCTPITLTHLFFFCFSCCLQQKADVRKKSVRKMQCLIFLVSLALTQGTVLKKKVLESVINSFTEQLPKHVYKVEEFSFILALSAPECLGDRPPELLATVNSGYRSRSVKMGPTFSHSTAHFLNPSNHMALYPKLDGSCPEKLLLSEPTRSWFSSQAGVTSRLPGDSSGCVVFFTRRSPCEGSCIDSHLIRLLADTPFSDRWIQSNGIDKYFVFTSEFETDPDGRCREKSLLPQLTASVGETKSPFSPWSCTRIGKRYKCEN
ncbi:hypothetical protein GN956_G16291 [Arapaima gigas]